MRSFANFWWFAGEWQFSIHLPTTPLISYCVRNVESTSWYKQRLENNQCVYPGCAKPPDDGSALCTMHHKRKKRRDREWRAQKMAERVALSLCPRCPGNNPAKLPPGQPMCDACRIRNHKLVRVDGYRIGGISGQAGKAERMAAATIKGEDGRTRYHGQRKRGNQPHIQLDEQDLEYARRAIEAGEAGLREFERALRDRDPVLQRESLRDAALHQLGRAGDFIDEVLHRRGAFKTHVKARHGPRGEDA